MNNNIMNVFAIFLNRLIHEALACPNKTNKYHECTDYCRERWGFKKFEPDEKLEKKRIHMLKKHPLPENWQEVADPETWALFYGLFVDLDTCCRSYEYVTKHLQKQCICHYHLCFMMTLCVCVCVCDTINPPWLHNCHTCSFVC